MSNPDLPPQRTDESFLSDGVRCAAWVYRPASPPAAQPVIVMAHGLGGVRSWRLPAYAERFAANGYVTVVFDYRSFGDSDGQPRQMIDIAAQLDDWRAALAFARTIDGVDPHRVIAWGTSLSGGHVITVAGTGESLAAAVAQVPHVSGPAAVRATGLRQTLRLAPAVLDDTWRSIAGRAPRYVPSAGAPGTAAIMATPDAEPGMARLIAASVPASADTPTTVAARIGLRIGAYSPIRHAADIACPVLIQVAADDAITPPAATRKAAGLIRNATLRSYLGGHFDPYVDPLFEAIVVDQVAFLKSAVPVA